MAVRLAPVVQPGDRLLADVAALGEADRALVDPGLLGDRRRRHLAAEARPARLDPDDLGGRLVDRLGAARDERLERGARPRRAATQQVDAEVGGDGDAPRSPPTLGLRGGRARAPAGPPSAISAAAGPITEITRALVGDVLDRRRRGRSCTSSGGAGRRRRRSPRCRSRSRRAVRSDAHVALHVALAVEQRRVAALAGRERLDVVGELALQVLGRLGAGDRDQPPVGALERSGALAQDPVLGVELDRGRRTPSPPIVTGACRSDFDLSNSRSVDDQKNEPSRRSGISRRRLLAGGVVAAPTLALLHETVPHQGLHDALGGGSASAADRTTRPRTRPAAKMAHGGGAEGPTFRAGRERRPRRQRLQPDRDPARLRLRQDHAGWRAAGCCASGSSSPPTRRSRSRPGVSFPAWTYNGRVPGPTLRCREGELLRIRFVNGSEHPHTIHFHGLHPAVDGRHPRRRRRDHRAGQVDRLRVRRRALRPAPLPLPRRRRSPSTSRAASTAPSSSTRSRGAPRPTRW